VSLGSRFRWPAYHEMMAIFGVGDLHPGGEQSTDLLIAELEKAKPASILEVGAGAGYTTARMVKRGWRVTSVEPSAILCEFIRARHPAAVFEGSFDNFDSGSAKYDAIVGEGVFYGLDPARTVEKIHGLLRPGGLLASSDMVWTDRANADIVSYVHQRTKELFGVPMASKDSLAASTWRASLLSAGFKQVLARDIEQAAFDPDRRIRRVRSLAGLLRRPHLIPLYLNYRSYQRINWVPADWLRSEVSVWRLTE